MNPADAPLRNTSPWRLSFREAGVLLLAALLLTVFSWLVRPVRLPLRADPAVYELELAAPLLGIDEALRLFDEGNCLFIDTRPQEPGLDVTIAGAFIIRETSFDDDLLRLFDDLYPEDQVVLFGDGNLAVPNSIALRLQARGFTDVRILQGGIRDWQAAGGQTGRPYFPALPAEPAEEADS